MIGTLDPNDDRVLDPELAAYAIVLDEKRIKIFGNFFQFEEKNFKNQIS